MLKPLVKTFSEDFLFDFQFGCEEFEATLNEDEQWSYRDMMEYAFEFAMMANRK